MAPAELAAKSRKMQGLPAKITDPATLVKIAALLKGRCAP
jgi:hypothetical protein